MNRHFKFLSLLATPLALTACSTAAENHALDQKVAQEAEVQTPNDLDVKAKTLTSSTPGLSPELRQKLDAIRLRVRDQLAAIREESAKLEAVLVQDVLAPKADSNEVAAVKKRLRKLSKKRIDTLFTAADDANEALGRNELARQAMDLQFLNDGFNYW